MKGDVERVLVTGGAGFIGSHLVDALLEQGHHVVVIDNFSSGDPKNLAHRVGNARLTVLELDIRDYSALTRAMESASIVFHLAVQCLRVSLQDPVLVHEVNAGGTLNVALAAQACGAERLVYVSSSEVYGTAVKVPMDEGHPLEPTTVYGASKLAGEHYCRAVQRTYGLPTIIVRPFNTYGPRSHLEGAYGEVIPRFLACSLLGQAPVIFGDGQQTRDFIYASDTVRGILLAAACDGLIGDVVNIAYGHPVTIEKLADHVLTRYGKRGLRPVFGPARPGDVRAHHADITKAQRLLRFQPEMSLEKGLDLYYQWLRQQPAQWERMAQQYAQVNWQ